MLVVANWNMHDLRSVYVIVGNQVDAKIFVKSQLLLVKQADDRFNTEACFGLFKPGINDALRYWLGGLFFICGLGPPASCSLITHLKHGEFPLNWLPFDRKCTPGGNLEWQA